MSKHTPGPWTYSTTPQPNGCPIVGANGLMVAMLAHSVNYGGQRETAVGNARLIAAAPDLLDVLEDILNDGMHCDVVPHLHAKARAAIAKATGEAK